MIDHLNLEFKSYGDNIALIAIGIPKGRYKKDMLQWFRDIQKWKGKYDDSNPYLRSFNDSITEKNEDDIDYGSDSESCKFDFTACYMSAQYVQYVHIFCDVTCAQRILMCSRAHCAHGFYTLLKTDFV